MWVRWSLMLVAVALPTAGALSTNADVHAAVEADLGGLTASVDAAAEAVVERGGDDRMSDSQTSGGFLAKLRDRCRSWAASAEGSGEAGAGIGLAVGLSAVIALGRRFL